MQLIFSEELARSEIQKGAVYCSFCGYRETGHQSEIDLAEDDCVKNCVSCGGRSYGVIAAIVYGLVKIDD